LVKLTKKITHKQQINNKNKYEISYLEAKYKKNKYQNEIKSNNITV